MPPHGLSLEEVSYPAEAELADRAREARAVRTAEGDQGAMAAQPR
jgi:tRNA pseudouridine38-40 synthase